MGNARSRSAAEGGGRAAPVDEVLERYAEFHEILANDFSARAPISVIHAMREVGDISLSGRDARRCLKLTHDLRGRSLLDSLILPFIHFRAIARCSSTERGARKSSAASFATMRAARELGEYPGNFIARLLFLALQETRIFDAFQGKEHGYSHLYTYDTSLERSNRMRFAIIDCVAEEFAQFYAGVDPSEDWDWPLGNAILAHVREELPRLIKYLTHISHLRHIVDHKKRLDAYVFKKMAHYFTARAIADVQARNLPGWSPPGERYLTGRHNSKLPFLSIISIAKDIPLTSIPFFSDKDWEMNECYFFFDGIDAVKFFDMPVIDSSELAVCAICLENCDGARCVLPCSPANGSPHSFHTECIVDWVSKIRNCPLCRTAVHRRAFSRGGKDGRAGGGRSWVNQPAFFTPQMLSMARISHAFFTDINIRANSILRK